MPPKKEEWEVRFEEYRDTLVSLGAKIKNEKAKQPPQQKEAKKRKRARPSANALKNTKAAYRKKALSLTTKTGCGKSSVQSAAGWITDKSANL